MATSTCAGASTGGGVGGSGALSLLREEGGGGGTTDRGGRGMGSTLVRVAGCSPETLRFGTDAGSGRGGVARETGCSPDTVRLGGTGVGFA